MGTRRAAIAGALVPLVGCVALTGAGDLREERGGTVAPSVDASHASDDVKVPPLPDADAPETSTPLPVGRSEVTLSGTGVAVGAEAIATLTVKDAGGAKLARTGAAVVLTATGGTSVLDIGAVADVGDGTYRVPLRGMTVGTPVEIRATLDGVALATTAPSLRVVDPVAIGLTFAVDAANAAPACAAAWNDLSANQYNGTLTAFPARPCTTASGWNGTGKPEDPYRLTFDGVDDAVTLGAVNSLAKQTLVVVARKDGLGVTGNTGAEGFDAIFPLVTKGTAEEEAVPLDVNFYLGITPGGRLGTDFEQSNPTVSANNPLSGGTNILDGTWYVFALSFDPAAASRVLYVNGRADGNAATTNTPSSGDTSRFVIGGSDRTTGAPNGRFKGDIAIVRTYDRALSAAEIAQTCQAYSSRFGIQSCP